MAKKSRRAAARYSELSRDRKKKQRGKDSAQPKPAVAAKTAVQKPAESIKATAATRSAASRTAARPQAGPAQPLPGYQYVRGELRKIGILAGAAVVILIVLTFVLG